MMAEEVVLSAPRRGRKPKIPAELRRHNQTVRIRASTRQVLLEAARQNGRSMSEEIEARLELSLLGRLDG